MPVFWDKKGAIIVHLIGGLGNQLFQFALGRMLSLQHNAELLLDATGFENYTLHRLSLQHFAINARYLTREENASIFAQRSRLDRAIQRLLPVYRRRFFDERSFGFDSAVLRVRPPVYLRGYWQTEKYFAEIAETLRRDLNVIHEPSPENARRLGAIRSGCAVSLHIRRGDYVSNTLTHQVHGTCSLEYYREASRLIAERTRDRPTFYVFSDDTHWVEQNLKLDYPIEIVTGNDDKNYEDLRLMSACRHHIIANSSFSWWGAWLNPSPDKIVVAPRRWFATDERDTRDILPASWVRL